jgi:hypothetical protein
MSATMSGFPRITPPTGPAGGDLTGSYPDPTVATSGGSPILRRVATTGPNGFALQNGTPTILTWTAPDDGQLHTVLLAGRLIVTAAETGGAWGVRNTTTSNGIQVQPGGTSVSDASVTWGGTVAFTLFGGETIAFLQLTALTAGAATVYAEIWAE